jgi:menaquinone-dependent protoporphyrinogen oxidase
MTGRVLVAYGSSHGSTREVAAEIAAELHEHGLSAVMLPAREVGNLEGYDGVIIGAAIYMGKTHRDVRRLLRRFHHELAALPVAVFAMGPLSMEPKEVGGSRRQLEHALAKVSDVKPIALAIFGGVVKPEELHFPFSKMPETDARDWDAIDAWAEEVADAFRLSRAAPVGLGW